MRLQQFMASCGVASRRVSEEIISAGRVTINGHVATLGQSVDPAKDDVQIDGKPILTDRKVYILFNKPRGVITTVTDTHGRKTVMHFVEDVPARVFPVGRLDYDVEGALFMTNDGDLAFRLTHPKYEIEKVYLATVKGKMTADTARALAKGVRLEDGMTAPAKVKILSAQERSSQFELVLTEGRNREVKRMCMHVGHPVVELKRLAMGNIGVKKMRPGDWRYLTATEVDGLRRLTGLTSPTK